MIPYKRVLDPTVLPSSVKIIGLGGAGANMLERIALDGMDGTELLALNTDARTLSSCIAKDKIQLGSNLTKGLGAGGDPELGNKAALEAETEIRAALKGRKIVFICTGLGGGTGSGGAPLVTRIAREEGAFVVVFATIPFAFEGNRRREQAETTLNELAVLSNALVTFDNNRMGELVLAKQGIHEAFAAADHMIAESIKAVIRLVVRPGLINVGLDDLMSALNTNRSRCLFGSGLANGKDRASRALRNALSSPLLDQGALLKEASTVLVHLCGGEDLTLFEVELLMQQLQKHVPESAHLLFGAAVDPSMGDSLSVTLISALPEESLAMAPRAALSQADNDSPLLEDRAIEIPQTPVVVVPTPPTPVVEAPASVAPAAISAAISAAMTAAAEAKETPASADEAPAIAPIETPATVAPIALDPLPAAASAAQETPPAATPASPSLFDNGRPFAEAGDAPKSPFYVPTALDLDKPKPAPAASISEFSTTSANTEVLEDSKDSLDDDEMLDSFPSLSPIPGKRVQEEIPRLTKPKETSEAFADLDPVPSPNTTEQEIEIPKLKLGVKAGDKPQNELGLDTAPRGRFEGENPNVFEGEDLDLPPFLRKKK